MIKHRTPEWYKARIGKFTASNFGKLMSNPADKTAKWSKSLLNCVDKAVSQEYYNRYYERPDSASTRWGTNYEFQAIQEFAKKANYLHRETGFVLHPTIKDIGATPDAQIIENENSTDLIIAEIKCPHNQSIHQKYVDKISNTQTLKKSKSEYFWQIQGAIWITGAKHGYFVSFDPRIHGDNRVHYVKIEKDIEAINKLKQRVFEAIELKNRYLEEIKQGIRYPKSLESRW